MLAYYLHDLSPDLIRFTDTIGIHWYGLAYVMGFYFAYLVMRNLATRGYGQLKPEAIGDFITLVSIFGVVLGGRIGYMLLYDFESFVHNPLIILQLWKGGMASHGGILGIVIFTWFYARKHKLSWPGLGDNLVVGAPLGLLFGRIANFINGELWGHPTTVPWAVKFPTEIHTREFIAPPTLSFNPDALPMHSNEIIAVLKQTPTGLQELIEALPPRHPSQLYEALLEGLFLFVVLYLVRTRCSKNLPHGVLTGLFFILYAIVRIFGETYRVPDSSLIMGITKGQFYSVFMIGIGLAFLFNAWVSQRRTIAK